MIRRYSLIAICLAAFAIKAFDASSLLPWVLEQQPDTPSGNWYDDLSGYWPLNDGSGSTADNLADDGIDGTLSGDANFTTYQGAACVDFDTWGDSITMGDNYDTRTYDYLISAWVNRQESGSGGIIGKYINGTDRVHLSIDNSSQINGALIYGGKTMAISSSVVIPSDAWIMVSLYFDRSTGISYAYTNGVQAASQAGTAVDGDQDNAAVFAVGYNSLYGHYACYIADVAVQCCSGASVDMIATIFSNTKSKYGF